MEIKLKMEKGVQKRFSKIKETERGEEKLVKVKRYEYCTDHV